MHKKKRFQFITALAVLSLILVQLPVQPLFAQQFTDTTVADFTVISNTCYIGEADDGEILLVPAVGEEFYGTIFPSGWITSTWDIGGTGSVVMGGGLLTVDSAFVATETDLLSDYDPGHSLEYVATFGAEGIQHLGFGQNYDSQPQWAIFSTHNSTTVLSARTSNGINNASDVQLLGLNLIGSSHHYRIDWNATETVYYIDGSSEYTETAELVTANLRPAISDYSYSTIPLQVDWIRMSPYSSPCEYMSDIFDAGISNSNPWVNLNWNGTTPPGTVVTFEIRTGADDTPDDGGWGAWVAVDADGNFASIVTGQYAQYRATLTTSDDKVTPIVEDVSLFFADRVWNGNSDSDWGNAANWTPSGVPAATDGVLIPGSGPTNWPEISGLATSDDLLIHNGAELGILETGSLSVDGKLTNNGTFSQTISSLTIGTGNSFLHIRDQVNSTDKYFGVVITPTAVMGQTSVAIRGNSDCTLDDPVDTVDRCFEIVPNNQVLSDIRFYYLNSEEDTLNPANMRAWHWGGSLPWSVAGTHEGVGTALPDYNWVEVSGVSSYSPFVLSDAVAGPTVVHLQSFVEASNNGWSPLILILTLIAMLFGMMVFIMRKRGSKN